MKANVEKYTITLNKSKKTYTIRRYDNGTLTAKYRTYPQGKNFTKEWTESDIKNYLRYNDGDYYPIK